MRKTVLGADITTHEWVKGVFIHYKTLKNGRQVAVLRNGDNVYMVWPASIREIKE